MRFSLLLISLGACGPAFTIAPSDAGPTDNLIAPSDAEPMDRTDAGEISSLDAGDSNTYAPPTDAGDSSSHAETNEAAPADAGAACPPFFGYVLCCRDGDCACETRCD